jgi:L-ascorbate metabolism protein UlaG (beta-lactamase superfamily)
MRITKFGHSCLLIEEGKARFLLDPGVYNPTPDVSDLDAILITHEHADHLSLSSLKKVLEKNPSAEIITHEGVGSVLAEEKIPYRIISDRETITVNGVAITSYGVNHEVLHQDIPIIRNTGFLIAKRFFYPGDKLYQPEVPVEILALPITAPWTTIGSIINYATLLAPKIAMPVHDGMLRQDVLVNGPTRALPRKLLEAHGIQFVDMLEGSVWEG